MEKAQGRSKRIDALAIAICTPMESEKKNEFFEFQERREKSGEACKKKYYVGRTYYKGLRKGQLRDVFEVDGKGFNELWTLLSGFAVTVANSFYRSRKIFSWDVEDALSDIRYQTLYVLRFFGPTPNGGSFAQLFPTVCRNILSTNSRRMYGTKDKELTQEEADKKVYKNNLKWDPQIQKFIQKGACADKTKVNFKSVSLHNDIMIEEDSTGAWEIDRVRSTGNELENIEFQACIPENLKEIVNFVVNGHSLREVSEMTNIEFKDLKKLLKNFAADFHNARV